MSKDAVFIEYPSFFRPERRPVYILDGCPSVRGAGRMSTGEHRVWLNKIDSIVRARSDRKGIIHTVSYGRAEEILASSGQKASLIGHDRRSLARTIERFRSARPPSYLVSPSVREGFDFPYDQCEVQIIAKVPFIDHSGAVIAARHRDDKRYLDYLAIQSLIQSCGRGMRSADDRCETFIVDGNIGWLLARNKRIIPAWFRRAVRYIQTVPAQAPPRVKPPRPG